MFNKLKFVANALGNKMQRNNEREEAKKEIEMAITLTKIELMKKRIIYPYLKNTVNDAKCPSYELREAVWMTKEMDENSKKARIKFLLDNGVKSITDDEDNVVRFVNMTEEEKK